MMQKLKNFLAVVIFGLVSTVGFAQAATTISTDISTGGLLTVSGAGTSTFSGGISLSGGCFAIAGTCIGSGTGTAVGGTGAVQFANGAGFNGDTKFFWDNATKSLAIGASSAYAKLSVQGVNGSTQPLFDVATSTAGSATSSYFRIDYNGRVGIGMSVTPPAYKLDIQNTGLVANQSYDVVRIAEATTGKGFIFGYTANSAGNAVANSYFSSWGDMTLGTPNSSQLLFLQDSTGNVGVGSTSPYAKLSVAGPVVASYFTGTSSINSTFGGNIIVNGAGTSTFANGINLTTGCFAVAGSCISTASSSVSLSGANTWTALQIFNAQATSTQFTATNRLYVGGTGSTSIILPTNATSTFGGIQGTALNITGTATSTFANGITLSGGCVTVQGACIGTSSGASLSANNTWTGTQTFTGATTTFSPGLITPIIDSPGGLTIGTSTATQIVIGRTGSATYLSGAVAFGGFGSGTQINGLLYGACTIGTSTPISASGSAIVGCTTAAINLTTSYRVFITPVGMPSGLIVQAASTTATNLISLQIFNANSTTTSTTASPVSFFAVQ